MPQHLVIFTGILAQNDLWDKSQMGTHEKVLGTVDQLLIDNAYMREVRDHHRNFGCRIK